MSADNVFSYLSPIEDKSLDDLARRKGCTITELVIEELDKLEADNDYRERVAARANEMWSQLLQQRRIDHLWPTDRPLECELVALRLGALMDDRVDQKIADLAPEQMEYWDREVKRTGRSLTALLNDVLFGVGERSQ